MASLQEHILNHKEKVDKESLAKINEEAPNDLLFFRQKSCTMKSPIVLTKVLVKENKNKTNHQAPMLKIYSELSLLCCTLPLMILTS